jgi:hypothetical protein
MTRMGMIALAALGWLGAGLPASGAAVPTAHDPQYDNCTLGLSFKSEGYRKGARSDDVGLLLFPGGVIAVTSADPTAARLVFRRHRRENETKPFEGGEPPEIAAMPHGITMLLLGETRFGGVLFEDVVKGGIAMLDPRARSQWKHVAFGPGNFGPAADLFAASAGRENHVRTGGGQGRGIDREGDAR